MRKMAQTTANLVGSCLSKSNMTTEGITNEEETPEIHDPVSGSPMTTAGKIHYVISVFNDINQCSECDLYQ